MKNEVRSAFSRKPRNPGFHAVAILSLILASESLDGAVPAPGDWPAYVGDHVMAFALP